MLLTYEQAADELSVSVSTVRRLVEGGALPCVLVTKDAPRVSRDELEAFVERHTSRTQSAAAAGASRAVSQRSRRASSLKERLA